MNKRVYHTQSSSTSMIHVEKFSYDWTIENTETLSNIFCGSTTSVGKFVLNSGTFKAGTKVGKPAKWFLSLGVSYKRNASEFISLHLALKKLLFENSENSEGHYVQTAFSLELLNRFGKSADCGQTGIVNYGFKSQNPFAAKVTACWGWDDFLTFDELKEMIEKAVLSKEKIVFRVKIDIFGTAEKVSKRQRFDLDLPLRPLSLVESYSQLLRSGQNSDVVVATKDKIFPVHKLILSVASPVFGAMFNVDMKENNSNTIDLSSMDSDVVDLMLKYIYSRDVKAELEENSTESISKLMCAAHMYQLDELKDECMKYLLRFLNVENAPQIAVWTYLYHPQREVFEEVQEYFLRNMKEIRSSDSFKKLFEENPRPFDFLIFEVNAN